MTQILYSLYASGRDLSPKSTDCACVLQPIVKFCASRTALRCVNVNGYGPPTNLQQLKYVNWEVINLVVVIVVGRSIENILSIRAIPSLLTRAGPVLRHFRGRPGRGEGGRLDAPRLIRLLGVVARNKKQRSNARQK